MITSEIFGKVYALDEKIAFPVYNIHFQGRTT